MCALNYLTRPNCVLRKVVSWAARTLTCPLHADESPGAHPNCCRLCLKRDGTRTETRFRLSAKRTSPFKSAGTSVQSTTGSWGVRISGSNAGFTMFWGSVKGTGYPLHSPVSPSLPLLCVTGCHHIPSGLYIFILKCQAFEQQTMCREMALRFVALFMHLTSVHEFQNIFFSSPTHKRRTSGQKKNVFKLLYCYGNFSHKLEACIHAGPIV
jgi:hypothetical protein